MYHPSRMLILLLLIVTIVVAALPASAQDGEPYDPVIEPEMFVDEVDNAFFPLTPGTLFIYEGETEDGTELIRVFVTYETREILDIACTVVQDTVWEDGELVEDTFDWYAQDVDGNVWYFGEDSTEYEDGEAASTAGSWEAGVDDAKPGIIMWGDPQIGTVSRQEFYEGEAEDMAEVISLTGSASVAYGDYDELVITEEWTPLEPGIAEQKYYAAETGLVLEEMVEGGGSRVELIEIISLAEDELDELDQIMDAYLMEEDD